MEPTQHSPLDLPHTLALGSERLPSPPSPHLSLSKSALVRADLVSLEKCITSHFNSLLGLPLLGCPISRWKDLPRVLANIQQYVDGVPPVCIPIVDGNDRFTNDIRTWNEKQHSAMQCALNGSTIRACPRPVDRKVIFTSKVPDPNSGHLKLVDSTCGYSPMWLLQNMFTEQCYSSQTIDVMRQKQVPQFEALIGPLNNQKTIPWRRLPLILWNAGMMVTGMPRVCTPKPLDKHRSDGLKGLWPRAWRVWLQRVLDSGVLRVDHCPPDHQVVIRILEEDYSFTDDHYGLASHSRRKLRAPHPPSGLIPSVTRSTVLESPTVPAPIPTILSQPISFTAPSSSVPTEDIAIKFTALLKRAGVIFGDPITGSSSPSWRRLPEMLAAKRIALLGYPAGCLPEVQDDRVVGSYKPKHWNTQAREAMMAALVNGSLRIGKMPRGNGVTPMYFVALDGYLQGTTLGYSREWVEDRLVENPSDIGDPKGFVVEQWISLLENDFPVYNVDGERTIPWTTLPLWLARRRQYIDGCPEDCLPKIEDGRVAESSSPYNYNIAQMHAITWAFVHGEISLRTRPDEDTMLFRTKDAQGRYTHHTLGFSHSWINENMKSVANRIEPHQLIKLNTLPIKPGSPLILHAQTLENVPTTEPIHSTTVLAVNVSLPSSPPVRLKPTPTQSSVSSNNDTHSGSSRTSSHGSVVPIVGASSVKFVIPPARRKAHEQIEFTDRLTHHPLPHSMGFYPTGLPYTPPLIATPTGTPPPTIVPYPFPGYIPTFHPPLVTHSVPAFPSGFTNNVKKPKARTRTKVGAKPKQQFRGKAPPHRGRRISSPFARVSSVLTPPYAQANNAEPERPMRIYEVDFEGGEPEPGTFGLRDSLSPQAPDIDLLLQYGMDSLPRRATGTSHGTVLDEDMEGVEHARTRDELPVPIPVHLPKPGGELYYHVEAQTWELTMGGGADEAAWGKALPVFPCRVIWNATREVWRCVPCEWWEMVTAEERVRMERDKRIIRVRKGWQNEDVPFIMEGLALVWQRSRRKWTLEEYVEEQGERRFLREGVLE